ncbi:DUF6401 family natural product biosynthesis protein [Nonomuraea sp. NPDC047897]|uniref:DUF6401 family natural product biosynthesis protein n=1 Tax=Nonomuraea sp. NPDC047897 TaxID=3364346 RepID=UPI00371165C2
MLFENDWAASPLRWLMETLGHAQLERMAAEPGLVAAVDQHAAELRETISLDRETLGDYLLGFADELRERNWSFQSLHSGHDPAAVRLTAICWLARELNLLDESPA